MSLLLAHLSDSHIGPLPVPLKRELIGKRFTGYVNWGRRKGIHDMGVLARIVADIHAHKPDHIAMTGDILNIALPAEFPLARAWLGSLGKPHDVSFTPGNHDGYVASAMPMILDTFGPWCANDGETHASFPYLRVRGDVALIGVSSAIPTLPFLASGRVGAPQRAALGRLLDGAAARGLMRVVMIHHPPWRGGATPGRGLRDARAFEAVIARHGADLILHGHNHRLLRHDMQGDGRRAPSIGVASASAVPGSPKHRAAWHLYRIERAGNAWKIETRVRGMLPGSDEIGDIDTFAA